MSAGVVAAAQIGKSAAALPVLQAEFDLSLSAAAWYISLISVIGAVAGTGLGWVGQSLGFRREVQSGLVLILLMNLAGALSQGPILLMVTRVGESLGFALVVLAAPGLLTGTAGRAHRRLVMGAWGAYMPIGTGFGTLLVPLGIGLADWRAVWGVSAVVTLAALVAVTRKVPAGSATTRPRPAALLAVLRSPGMLCLAAVFTVYSGQYLAVLGLLPTMLVGEGAMSVATAGAVTAVAFAANAPGNIAGAVLQHRGVPRYLLLIGGSVCMGVTVWVVHDGGMPVAGRIAGAVAFSFLAGVVPSAAFGGGAALTVGTESVGAGMGLLLQASSLGQLFVLPLVTTATAAGIAAPVLLCALAAVAGVGGLLYRTLDVREGR
jgi:MFS family permease